MEDRKLTKSLYNLAIAGLIGEGEFDHLAKDIPLKIPFSRKKGFYLADLLKDGNLNSNLRIDPQKGQFTIHSHKILQSLKKQWYKDNTKIFSNILDPKLINLDAIIISINLFGSRKLESISIPTSIDKDYVKAISYCIEQHLKVPVIPGANQIKITNIPQFIDSVITEIPTIHSAELINFLTVKEKKRLVEGVSL
ncbi:MULTISPECIES: hypothetical protein [Bacillota]|uniref:hypothetical protein n=1 Tax=Bacillota TaxID=1239 RepID=UPI0039EF36D7